MYVQKNKPIAKQYKNYLVTKNLLLECNTIQKFLLECYKLNELLNCINDCLNAYDSKQLNNSIQTINAKINHSIEKNNLLLLNISHKKTDYNIMVDTSINELINLDIAFSKYVDFDFAELSDRDNFYINYDNYDDYNNDDYNNDDYNYDENEYYNDFYNYINYCNEYYN